MCASFLYFEEEEEEEGKKEDCEDGQILHLAILFFSPDFFR